MLRGYVSASGHGWNGKIQSDGPKNVDSTTAFRRLVTDESNDAAACSYVKMVIFLLLLLLVMLMVVCQ